MNKLNPSGATSRSENSDTNLQDEQILLLHANSAAGVLTRAQSLQSSSQMTLTKGVVGVVAKLGKVNDENLSQLVPVFHLLFHICHTFCYKPFW